MEASVHNYEEEGDENVAVGVGDPDQDPFWVGINVRWEVESQTPHPWIQAGAYQGVRWQEGEGLGGADKDPVGDVHKVQVGGGGHWVLEGEGGHVVPGLVEVFEP